MNSPFIIAEVAQNHDGSLGLAHSFIDAVARTGADAVKFQTHIAIEESSSEEAFRVHFSYQDATRYDYWRRMEFTPEQWAGLKKHAEEKGLIFLSSPFSHSAVELLERLGIVAWKVGSGEMWSLSMLERMSRTGKPIYISTGLATWTDIDDTVRRLKTWNANFTLMQCTTRYPSPVEEIGLNILTELHARYACPVGLSDHSGTIFPSIAATVLGASAIEVHVTFSREIFGPDVVASVTIDELSELVRGVRAVTKMLSNPVDKTVSSSGNDQLRRMFGKGAMAKRDFIVGERPSLADIEYRKPAIGISEVDFHHYTDKRLLRAVKRGEFIKHEDYES